MHIFISAYLSQAHSEYAEANVCPTCSEFVVHLVHKPACHIGDGYFGHVDGGQYL